MHKIAWYAAKAHPSSFGESAVKKGLFSNCELFLQKKLFTLTIQNGLINMPIEGRSEQTLQGHFEVPAVVQTLCLVFQEKLNFFSG